MLRHYSFLLLGVFMCSTSVIWINASSTHPAVLSALRLVLASLILLPIFLRDLRRHAGAFTLAHLRRTTLPAILFALHILSWSWGSRMTLAAQATLVATFAPAVMPFFLHWLVGEHINRREIIGTCIALCGVVLLTLRDALAPGGSIWGNLVCFGSMLLFAYYLALGRKNRDFPTIWLYIVPVYAQAAVICALCALPWWGSFEWDSSREWGIMLGLAVMPTLLGHTVLNASVRFLRGQVVSLCNLGQFLFAGLMAWALFSQVPPGSFYFGSGLVVAGAALVVFAAPTAPPRMR